MVKGGVEWWSGEEWPEFGLNNRSDIKMETLKGVYGPLKEFRTGHCAESSSNAMLIVSTCKYCGGRNSYGISTIARR